MKKFFSVLLLLLVITAAVPAPAAAIPDTRQLPRLVDQADLLSSSEERALLKELDEVSERLGFDVVVVTAMTLGGKSPRAYADDFFDYNGYGFGSAATACCCWSSWRIAIGGSAPPATGSRPLQKQESAISARSSFPI